MLKRIKFRAWQINHKVMCKVKNIRFNDNGDIESVTLLYPEGHAPQIITYSDGNEHFWMHDKDGNCVLKLMQYTGVKDKNSEEVYEGDILDNGEEKRIVKFKDGAFYQALLPRYENKNLLEPWFPVMVTAGILDDDEVIGDIYTIPELLKRR